MKVQNLAIIFIVVIIPIIMLLSYYFGLQEDTLEMQIDYDAKLSASVKEGIKSYEINTVNWRETLGDTRRTVNASVNTFIASLANNLGVSGTAKEYMVNYVPAVAMTMYDRYYIYAPSYVPNTLENSKGIQLYYDGSELTIKTETGGVLNDVAYKPKQGATNTINAVYTETDENGNEIKTQYTITTDATQADKVYKHYLSNAIAYSGNYRKGSTDLTINYTLDNRIYIYGKTGTEDSINEQGYLVNFDSATKLPRINIIPNQKDDTGVDVVIKVNEAVYYGSNINSEILTEQVIYKDEKTDTMKLETFKYIYDIEGTKRYYDENEDNFFTIDGEDKKRNYLLNTKNMRAGDDGVKYRSISVLTSDSTYKKVYQVLNGKDKAKWYMSLKDDPNRIEKVGPGVEVIDTELKTTRQDFGFSAIYRDYSAVSYYVEAYAFTNWVKANLGGDIEQTRIVFDESTKTYVEKPETLHGLFNISASNDMENPTSMIAEHKRQIMIDSINSNLNMAISNYAENSEDEYRLPVLTDADWDQVFTNISMIAFLQGVPIGLKTYNNYAIATSASNRDYIDPDEIFFSSNAINYHRPYCTQLTLPEVKDYYKGYRSIEYTLKTFDAKDASGNTEQIYYYQHTNQRPTTDTTSDLACYNCIVNKADYQKTVDKDLSTLNGVQREIRNIQTKAYKEALARERYYQNVQLAADLGIIIKYHQNIPQKLFDLGIITEVINMPEDQEAEPYIPVQISMNVPIAKTSDEFIQYKCVGWSLDPSSTVAAYKVGVENWETFDEGDDHVINLYAIWTVSLSSLKWKTDFYWNHSKPVWPGDGMHDYTSDDYIGNGTVSNVRIRDDEATGTSIVEMVGNSEQKGKGAVWTTFESEHLRIKDFSFDYSVNAGHSFNAAGFLFNVVETPTTIEGYMLSINFAGKFRSNAGGKSGAVYKFSYTKNTNSNQVESIQLEESLDLGTYGGSYSGGNGNIKIEILNNGYRISGNEIDDTIIIVDAMHPNTFGFFSDHFGRECGHTCKNIGFFKMSNIKVTVEFKE